MAEIGRRARAAARVLAEAPRAQKDEALKAMAAALRASSARILAANAIDVAAAEKAQRPASFIDRLRLDEARIGAMADGVAQIADLEDPVGTVMASWARPNGLQISRVRTPLGVIGIIFESRPNVTADAGALCLKAGNAALLRPGSESYESARAIHGALEQGLRAAGLPQDAIQIVPSRDREAVGLMLSGLGGCIDVIVPRGGKSLVARVQAEARVPVFSHLEGICHVYVHAPADLEMAKRVVVNAKMRRPGICGAAETLLVDRALAGTHLAPLVAALIDARCEVRGDEAAQAADARVIAAKPEDWDTEYLDAIISVAVVDGLEGALAHIAAHSSQHTESIITDDAAAAEQFLARVDSAIVLHNASTQFADGGEFGMGAEIGIATGRMHARGPVGVEQLTSFKYQVRGSGQTRP
ncbi:MAG: glutamate-5-semialdehyde dehydrogenase [Rhodobiaceae bacterium]|nr:glutamate-5-semialdehyde dehydrogenase [Rhodobiaceae bacterium]